MQIEKICYGRTYPLGNYASERIDMEASIDPEEPIEMVVEILKGKCDAIHKSNNPHLYDSQYISTPPDFAEQTGIHTIYTNNPDTFKEVEQKVSPEQEVEDTIKGIEAAETPEELSGWLLQAAKNQKTMGAFNRRKKQLNVQ